jgi:6-phosphogluconate dehydrogenase
MKNIGMIGLGKMGLSLALNMKSSGFNVIGFDLDKTQRDNAIAAGIEVADTIDGICQETHGPRWIWLMVPAGNPVDQTIHALIELLQPGDIVIDGGNSFYKDSMRRHKELEHNGIHYLDCGTSGGKEGARHGACLMVGGDPEVYEACKALFLAIGMEGGVLYTGPAGSGHFVKMVHNGIEYGMMQAIGEGFELLQASQFKLDLEAIAGLWDHGSVIRGWLMELTGQIFKREADLSSVKGVVNASGEGQWTVETAIEMGVPLPVITMSLMMRYASQQNQNFSGKVQAALRNAFGGHGIVT